MSGARPDVGRQGIDYPGVSCAFLCHDGKGRLLLHRRGLRCRDEQGTWDCGAGALELGETFEQAVTREVMEEYVARPLEIAFVGVRNILREQDGTQTHWVALGFAARVEPSDVEIGEPHKMDELGWFTATTLPEPLHSQFRAHLELCRAAGVV